MHATVNDLPFVSVFTDRAVFVDGRDESQLCSFRRIRRVNGPFISLQLIFRAMLGGNQTPAYGLETSSPTPFRQPGNNLIVCLLLL